MFPSTAHLFEFFFFVCLWTPAGLVSWHIKYLYHTLYLNYALYLSHFIHFIFVPQFIYLQISQKLFPWAFTYRTLMYVCKCSVTYFQDWNLSIHPSFIINLSFMYLSFLLLSIHSSLTFCHWSIILPSIHPTIHPLSTLSYL